MAEEVALLREAVAAQAALVRLVVGVGQQVFAAVRGEGKGPRADRALEGPFAGMHLQHTKSIQIMRMHNVSVY